jgi:hypothetical protein
VNDLQKFAVILIFLPALTCADEDPKWNSATVDDPSGYGSVVSMRQDSSKTIKDESAANEVTPVLEFRCTPGDQTVTARIDWQRFISSFSTEVGFKVDGGRFTWLKWKLDPSEQVTYSPSAADSQKLIDALKAGSELLVEVSPYSQGPETAEFDLAGFSDALESLVNECQ